MATMNAQCPTCGTELDGIVKDNLGYGWHRGATWLAGIRYCGSRCITPEVLAEGQERSRRLLAARANA